MNSGPSAPKRPGRVRQDLITPVVYITVAEFAEIAHLSRRQIDRLRKRRLNGFPREYELGASASKHGRSPRFKLADVLAWMETRALW
jgi:predicted DNA-binding transcriptional regulator AlpA